MRKSSEIILSERQKKQIIRWWIPALILLLKKKYKVSALYIEEMLPVDNYDGWFFVDKNICFPLCIENIPLGFVVSLSDICDVRVIQKIRHSVDEHLKKLSSGMFLNPFALKQKSPSSLPVAQQSFIIIRKKTEREIIKESHRMYLKTNNFAFLVMDEEEWLEGVSFEDMEDVFICIPSFYKLSVQQKGILREALQKPLMCFLSIGLIGNNVFPIEWESFLDKSHAVQSCHLPEDENL